MSYGHAPPRPQGLRPQRNSGVRNPSLSRVSWQSSPRKEAIVKHFRVLTLCLVVLTVSAIAISVVAGGGVETVQYVAAHASNVKMEW